MEQIKCQYKFRKGIRGGEKCGRLINPFCRTHTRNVDEYIKEMFEELSNKIRELEIKNKKLESKIIELGSVIPNHLLNKDLYIQLDLLIEHFKFNPESNTENVGILKEHFENLKF